MAYTVNMDDGKETNSIGERQENKRIADYTIEDKKNVINFHKSGRSKPLPHELDSIRRQYGKTV